MTKIDHFYKLTANKIWLRLFGKLRWGKLLLKFVFVPRIDTELTNNSQTLRGAHAATQSSLTLLHAPSYHSRCSDRFSHEKSGSSPAFFPANLMCSFCVRQLSLFPAASQAMRKPTGLPCASLRRCGAQLRTHLHLRCLKHQAISLSFRAS